MMSGGGAPRPPTLASPPTPAVLADVPGEAAGGDLGYPEKQTLSEPLPAPPLPLVPHRGGGWTEVQRSTSPDRI